MISTVSNSRFGGTCTLSRGLICEPFTLAYAHYEPYSDDN